LHDESDFIFFKFINLKPAFLNSPTYVLGHSEFGKNGISKIENESLGSGGVRQFLPVVKDL